jgi:hypothetical protein
MLEINKTVIVASSWCSILLYLAIITNMKRENQKELIFSPAYYQMLMCDITQCGGSYNYIRETCYIQSIEKPGLYQEENSGNFFMRTSPMKV